MTKRTHETDARLHDLVAAGMVINEIRHEMGISEPCARSWCKKLGLKPKQESRKHEIDWEKVSRVKSAIARGEYEINASAIASEMMHIIKGK